MIQVGIIEDAKQYREAVTAMLNATAEVHIAGTWPDAETALEAIPELLPDVVLTAINLTGMDGIECIRRLKKNCPDVQFIVLSVFEDEEKIFEALKAGAIGYLVKTAPPALILEAILEVSRGGALMSPGIAHKVIHYFQSPDHACTGDIAVLTKREKQVMELLSQGKIFKEIAHELGVTIHAIKKHIKNIYHKLQVQNKVEAVIRWRSL